MHASSPAADPFVATHYAPQASCEPQPFGWGPPGQNARQGRAPGRLLGLQLWAQSARTQASQTAHLDDSAAVALQAAGAQLLLGLHAVVVCRRLAHAVRPLSAAFGALLEEGGLAAEVPQPGGLCGRHGSR